MKTQILPADGPGALQTAIDLLAQGAVIAAPTDTVYGVICAYHREDAVEALFQVKDRPAQKALPILLAGPDQVEQVALTPLPRPAYRLMERFWPGPLTLVLPAQPGLAARLTAGGDTVGVRVPDHPVIRRLARQVGPLASSSANRSGDTECHTADQVLAQLAGRIPLILDGGEGAHGMASTVVRVWPDRLELLRPGPIGNQVQSLFGDTP